MDGLVMEEPPFIVELPEDLREYLREDGGPSGYGPRWMNVPLAHIQCLILARILRILDGKEDDYDAPSTD